MVAWDPLQPEQPSWTAALGHSLQVQEPLHGASLPFSGLSLPLHVPCKQRKPPSVPTPQVPGGESGCAF